MDFFSNFFCLIEPAKFFYSPLVKTFEKQITTIENQGKKQIKAIEGHGKQLVRLNAFSEKDTLSLSKQKERF